MAKKKKAVIDLSAESIAFELDGRTVRLISFNPNTMTLLVNFYHDDKPAGSDGSFPFAHLPKHIKKAIRPL